MYVSKQFFFLFLAYFLYCSYVAGDVGLNCPGTSNSDVIYYGAIEEKIGDEWDSTNLFGCCRWDGSGHTLFSASYLTFDYFASDMGNGHDSLLLTSAYECGSMGYRIVSFPPSYSEYINVDGQSGIDTIHGTKNDDIIFGGYGNDVIYGHDGEDFIRGCANHDVILGGADSDHIEGDYGCDIIYGEGGYDYLYGEQGDCDYIDGDGPYTCLLYTDYCTCGGNSYDHRQCCTLPWTGHGCTAGGPFPDDCDNY